MVFPIFLGVQRPLKNVFFQKDSIILSRDLQSTTLGNFFRWSWACMEIALYVQYKKINDLHIS